MTPAEWEFVNNTINKAIKLGKITKEEAQPYLDKLSKLYKDNKDDVVKQAKTTANEAKDKVKDTVDSAKAKANDPETVKKAKKEFDDIVSDLNQAKNKGISTLKKYYKKFKDKYMKKEGYEDPIDTYEVFDDLEEDMEIKRITHIPNTNINLDEGC